jgi:hypothetical protein
VALTDAHNNPVAGEAVAFTVSAGGGSVAAASVVTAADGRASTTWKMGPAGPQEVTVTAGDTSFAVIFHSTSV